MRRRFITADVFTDTPFGGNPVAVLPDAEGLTTDQMQKLAREFNLSETVFVLPPENPAHTKQLRIFVPSAEVPFAGHPTIGTAIALASIGELTMTGDRTDIVFEMKAGPVPVTIARNEGQPLSATLTAPEAPEVRPIAETPTMAALLSLQPDDVVQSEAASCGLPFLLIEVRNRSALAASRIDLGIADQIDREAWARWPLVFTRDASAGFDLQARMFAPGDGIPEDPATGSAAAALGGWLAHHEPADDITIRKSIAQGVEMGRPSRIEVEVEKRRGEVTAVRVTGKAVLISEGAIEIPEDG